MAATTLPPGTAPANPSRRSALGILATGPIAMLPPLAVIQCSQRADATMNADRHPAWLKERTAIFDRANAGGLSEPQVVALCDQLTEVEDRIIDAPALNPDEARAKLMLIAALWNEGSLIERERLTALVAEVAQLLAKEA